jgi:Ni,Fe-hydrogenase III small subunit
MSKLPPPSDTPRVYMNIGTFSGLDVLTLGTVESGATVELKDGSTGVVVDVKHSWVSLRPRSAQIRLKDGTITKVSSREIATVLREAPRQAVATADGDSSPVNGSGVPRAAGV